jgi:predicted transcriptional regulator of viral defense system
VSDGKPLNAKALQDLPATFRHAEAIRRHVNDRMLRQLESAGLIERTGRGLYRRTDADATDEDLLEIASRLPIATLCLSTALARHDLTDEIPAAIDIALPRNTWKPATRAPVRWHDFDRKTFDTGRELFPLDTSTTIGLYSAERSIIDAYRLRHREGPEQAHEALRRWLRSGGQPTALLTMAEAFPRAQPAIRQALEILL